MKIFGLEISLAKKDVLATPVYSDRGHWWPIIREPYTGAWQRNLEETVDTILTHSAAYACATLIANDIAKLPLRLVEKDSNGIWRETTSPSFSPVLRRPNGYQNRIQFYKNWVLSKLLHGNMYALKIRDNRSVVVGMTILDPTRTTVLIAPDGSVFYKLQKDNLSGITESVTVPASEIIHDVMTPLYHPLVGVSPITACGAASVGALAIQRNSQKFFSNGSKPGGVLTAPGSISDETATRLKETWSTNFAGDNYGKVAVLGDGLEYQPLTISAHDSQLIEQLKWDAATVCTAFHVPAYMVGVGDPPAYNNIEALNQQYYAQCLQDLIECIELCLDEGLGLDAAKDGKILGTEFDVESGLFRMDTATRIKAYAEGVKGGIYKPNEVRAKLDLSPVEGGDSVYLQQQNYSLEALAKRDDKEDPFSTGSSGPADPPADPPEEDLADASKSIADYVNLYAGITA